MANNNLFQPTPSFTWKMNRAERSHQVQWLAPLLQRPEGRAWFLRRLKCPCPAEEARAAEVFHLCYPLRDVFTADYKECRGKSRLEDQFIAFYNRLFGLPEDFGVQELWRTAPGNVIRHPAAGGRAGWYESFLRERISDREEYELARNMRRMLGTEADLLLLTEKHVVLVELKYLSNVRAEQYERQQMMGSTLAERLGKEFRFGMVVERDLRYIQVEVLYVPLSSKAAISFSTNALSFREKEINTSAMAGHLAALVFFC